MTETNFLSDGRPAGLETQGEFLRDPVASDKNSMAVLETIGSNQLRVRETYIRVKDRELSLKDVQYALGALLEANLIERKSNGFDCLYVLTKAGRAALSNAEEAQKNGMGK